MSTDTVPYSITPDSIATTPSTTTTSTTTTTTTKVPTSTSTLASTSSRFNTSSFTSPFFYSTSSVTNTTFSSSSQGQGNVAIICGVIFGVLGLAISLVACYIIVRKIREKREGNRRRLQYEESERKPYDPVQKDFDSDHNYQEIQTKAATNGENSEQRDGSGKCTESYYANVNKSNQPIYTNMDLKGDDSIETYEPIANPDRQSQAYIEMHVEPSSSRQPPGADEKVETTATVANSGKENLSEMPSYANMKFVNAEDSAKQADRSDYANTPHSLPKGQNGQSLKTEDHTKSKKHKGSKKKNTYDINSGSMTDLDDITYKL